MLSVVQQPRLRKMLQQVASDNRLKYFGRNRRETDRTIARWLLAITLLVDGDNLTHLPICWESTDRESGNS